MKTQVQTKFGQGIIQGLKEAVAFEEKGSLPGARVRKIAIKPLSHYKNREVKRIRENLKLTQRSFALLMGVSIKTVEAWENGRNEPNGTAQRMLYLLKTDSKLPQKYSLIGA